METDGTVVGEFLFWLATSCWSSDVRCWFSCCCFFFTNCSADLRSSRVTPWVDRRVSRTLLACAFLCVSDSSSRTGGTKDLKQKVILRTSKQKLFAGQQRIIRLRNPIFWLLIIGSLIHTCLAWKACLIEGHTYYLKNVLNMLLIADCWALVMFMELLVAVGSPDDVMVNIGAVVVVLAASPVVDMTWMLKLTSTLLSLLLPLLWLL